MNLHRFTVSTFAIAFPSLVLMKKNICSLFSIDTLVRPWITYVFILFLTSCSSCMEFPWWIIFGLIFSTGEEEQVNNSLVPYSISTQAQASCCSAVFVMHLSAVAVFTHLQKECRKSCPLKKNKNRDPSWRKLALRWE